MEKQKRVEKKERKKISNGKTKEIEDEGDE